jgi:hypothetical protein
VNLYWFIPPDDMSITEFDVDLKKFLGKYEAMGVFYLTLKALLSCEIHQELPESKRRL